MFSFLEKQEWNTRIQEYLYKLNTLLLDSDYEIKYDEYKVTKIIPEKHTIEFYNSRWDVYESTCLDYATEQVSKKNSYVLAHSLSDSDLYNKTIGKTEIVKQLDTKELFPEFCTSF